MCHADLRDAEHSLKIPITKHDEYQASAWPSPGILRLGKVKTSHVQKYNNPRVIRVPGRHDGSSRTERIPGPIKGPIQGPIKAQGRNALNFS